ncbi:MAG: alpha/beta hydrolase [Anaerolineales bacterium]|nr:alpha/beta hydrolase [Anaerolineales bacterium]
MKPKSSYLFLNGLRFHYLDWGGAGRPLVLVHGLASNARIWELVAPYLTAHFRVLALDQRSHGLTDPATEGWDFPAITRDLHAFIEALGLERPLLAGHSWGASTVLHYAAMRPGGPAGVVMVDGGYTEMSAAPGLTWEQAEARLRPPDLDGMPVEAFTARMRGWLGELFSDQVASLVLANFRIDEDDRLYRRLPIPYHMEIARAIYAAQTFTWFARARCPILLCPAAPPPPRDAGAEELLAHKRAGVERAARQPNVTVQWFVDTLHDIPLHRPADLAHAISTFGSTLAD